MAKIGELVVSIVGDNSSLTKSLNDSEKQVQGFGSSVASAFGSLVSLAGAAALAIKGIEFNKAAEQAQVSFEVMTGSAVTATNVLKELRDFANTTPLEFKDIRDATQTMLSFGISADKATKYIKMLGDVSGGNADKLRSLSLAFSQIQSTGKLMGQDLLQLINAGFNPLQEISAQTGKSMAQLKEEMADGAISAQMVTDAFESATSAGGRFNGMLERQGQTLAGAQSTFSDAFDTFLGETMAGATKPLVEFFRTLTEGFAKVGDNFSSIGDLLGGVVVILTKGAEILFEFLDKIPGPVLAFTAALVGVKLAMMAISAAAAPMGIAINSALGPIGLAITAIITGVALIANEVNNIESERLRREMNALAKELGVSVEEATKLKKVADELGISAREARDAFNDINPDNVKSLVDRSMDLLMMNENLEQVVRQLSKEYGLTGTQVLRVLEAQEILGQRTQEEINLLRQRLKLEEDTARARAAAQEKKKKATVEDRADEIAAAEAAAEAARKAKDQAEAEAKRKKEKAEADRKAAREELDQLLMSEEQKLIAEKKRLQAVAKNKEELAYLDKIYSDKFIELQLKEWEAVKEKNQKILDENEKTYREQASQREIKTEEELKKYKEEIEAAELTEEAKKELIEAATENYKKNVEEQKKANLELVDYVASSIGSLANSIQEIWDANLQNRLEQIEQETALELEAAGLKQESEIDRIQKELDAAIAAGDTALAKEKKDALEREKIMKNAERKAAQAQYDAAMNSYNLKRTMAIVDAAVAVIKVWTSDDDTITKIVNSVLVVAATAAELSTIEANKPQAPALFTGTTNPIAETGRRIVADQGMELVLPKGTSVLNNRETMNTLENMGGGGTMRTTLQINIGNQIAEYTVDLINNGLLVVEAFG